MSLKLFYVHTEEDLGWDTYDSFVICCESEEIARKTHPENGEYKWWKNEKFEKFNSTWVKKTDIGNLKVEFLGVADATVKKGRVCTSFRPG